MRKQKTFTKLTPQETETFKQEIENATTKMELYGIAGKLNNHPYHVNQDHVTFMGFMDIQESKGHCSRLLELVS
jgi:hypothetical protein